jgi:hypothetical protein
VPRGLYHNEVSFRQLLLLLRREKIFRGTKSHNFTVLQTSHFKGWELFILKWRTGIIQLVQSLGECGSENEHNELKIKLKKVRLSSLQVVKACVSGEVRTISTYKKQSYPWNMPWKPICVSCEVRAPYIHKEVKLSSLTSRGRRYELHLRIGKQSYLRNNPWGPTGVFLVRYEHDLHIKK